MPVPNVLLLTGTVPSDRDVGGLILRELVGYYPRAHICCFALHHDPSPRVPLGLSWLPLQSARLPFIIGADWAAGLPGRIATHCRFRRARHSGEPRLLRRIVEFGKRQKVELIWAVLSRPPVYRLAVEAADRLGVPLVCTVWDPPDSVCLNLRYDRLSCRVVHRDFDRALSAAERCGVVSETMGEEYASRYGVEPIVTRPGVDPAQRRHAATTADGDDRFMIGFCGTIYAIREWQTLLAALSSVKWRIAGRDAVLRVLGPSVEGPARGPVRIQWLGWHPPGETVRLLSECHASYLPYWFGAKRRTAVRLCFPSKLTTYLAAGRPILFHGPAYSSPPRFFERYPVAECCHSLEQGEIIQALERLATDQLFRQRAERAIDAAIDEELNPRVFRERFARLIGIAQHELLPASGAPTVRAGSDREPAPAATMQCAAQDSAPSRTITTNHSGLVGYVRADG